MLPGRHPPRRRSDLAQLRTRPSRKSHPWPWLPRSHNHVRQNFQNTRRSSLDGLGLFPPQSLISSAPDRRKFRNRIPRYRRVCCKLSRMQYSRVPFDVLVHITFRSRVNALRVLVEHRYEVTDPVIASEAGEQGDADVHHAFGLRDHNRTPPEPRQPMPLARIVPFDAVRLVLARVELPDRQEHAIDGVIIRTVEPRAPAL